MVKIMFYSRLEKFKIAVFGKASSWELVPHDTGLWE